MMGSAVEYVAEAVRPGASGSMRIARVLSALVAVLAAAASVGGLLVGVYRDNDLIVTAWKGNDLVTLVVVVPLLVGTLVASMRGSDRALLVWLGAVGYMLYNYLFYLFGAAFNVFFLLYVVLVALSLYAFVLGLASMDAGRIAAEFRAGTQVKWVAGLMLLIPLIMGGIELARAIDFLFTGQVPEDIVKTGHTTGVVYAMDLALLMPAIVVAAVLLWRRRPWGYVLATVLLVKGLTYPLALVAMSVLGTWDPLTPAYVFFWVLSSVAIGLLLVNMRPAEERSEVASRSGGGMSAVTR
jgi:hypothetical protein